MNNLQNHLLLFQKRPKDNPFDLVHSSVQRFYFNNSSGVILPGETMKFPFVFKSPNAGVFTEQWQFESRPVVCGGAALLVSLRGIAFAEDKFKDQRLKLEVSKNPHSAMFCYLFANLICVYAVCNSRASYFKIAC